MGRVPYDVVVIEADKLWLRMVIAPTWDSYHHWDVYTAFIEACGWTEREFDREMLRRIDLAWDNIRRQIWN